MCGAVREKRHKLAFNCHRGLAGKGLHKKVFGNRRVPLSLLLIQCIALNSLRYTSKGNVVYAVFFRWPDDCVLNLPSPVSSASTNVRGGGTDQALEIIPQDMMAFGGPQALSPPVGQKLACSFLCEGKVPHMDWSLSQGGQVPKQPFLALPNVSLPSLKGYSLFLFFPHQ